MSEQLPATIGQLELFLESLAEEARRLPSPRHFYQHLLEQGCQTLGAARGIAWRGHHAAVMSPCAHYQWDDAEKVAELFNSLLSTGSPGQPVQTRNLDGVAYLVARVGTVVNSELAATHSELTTTIVFAHEHQGAAAAEAAREELVAAIADVATDFETYSALREQRSLQNRQAELLRFAQTIHDLTDTQQICYHVVNDARMIAQCDRMSIVLKSGRKHRLIATSGIRQIERRSPMTRQLEELASLVSRLDETVDWEAGLPHPFPQVEAALDQYSESSHARRVMLVPLSPTPPHGDDERQPTKERTTPLGVLICEQFTGESPRFPPSLTESISALTVTALLDSLAWERLPFGRFLRSVCRGSHRAVSRGIFATLFLVAVLGGGVWLLATCQSDFTVKAAGRLQPVVNQHIFASRDALIDEVMVAHQQQVQKGAPLLRLRDPELDLEQRQLIGEIKTTIRQLDAVKATRSQGSGRELNQVESTRLSADQQQIEQRLDNLRQRLSLLKTVRESLILRAPFSGVVTTWDVDAQLNSRPVKQGQILLSIADLTSDWQLELDVPDDRIGYVLQAFRAEGATVPVRFRYPTGTEGGYEANVIDVGLVASAHAPSPADGIPTVKVLATPVGDAFLATIEDQARPGLTVRAEIACGKKSLGYIWFHDIWIQIIKWLNF